MFLCTSVIFITNTVIITYILSITMILFSANNALGINVIISNHNVTVGTDDADLINGCSYKKPECSQGNIIDGLESKDVLQGSSADDTLLGDDGDDELSGSDGNDRLFGEKGKDVLQGGFGGDLLIAGSGNDELYAGPGDDVLIGGAGVDYFDCQDGYDIVIDFGPTKGDTTADNCEVILTHSAYNIDLLCTNEGNIGEYYHNYQASSVTHNTTKASKETDTFSDSVSNILTMSLPTLECETDDDISISELEYFGSRSQFGS